MRVLITGALGFTARHLIELIASESECELYLTDCISGGSGNILNCDLTQRGPVEDLICKIRPERIYHLAGSFTNNYDIDYLVNVLSTKNILDALLKYGVSNRTLLIGSSAEYGFINAGDNPVSESHPLQPSKIHGLTKVYQTYLMNFYCRAYSMDIVMARTFNLSGDDKRISKLLFVGKVCEQIEKIKKGELSKIVVGNLEAKRDYIDVREAVKYYQKIMERGRSGEVYNVGSGSCVKMRDLLTLLLKEAGLDMKVVEEEVPLVPDKTDIPEIYADLRKIKTL
ncbi:MAG: GDP-mannose 4,6-dehydratase [Candidatus Omnitrophica bacterium]|nr:GDP-mannose 4,6-dehydratase [Candidatus Omnitrophota bacterium]